MLCLATAWRQFYVVRSTDIFLEAFSRAECLLGFGSAEDYGFTRCDKGSTGAATNHLRPTSSLSLHLVSQAPNIAHRSVDEEAEAGDRLENIDDKDKKK